MEVRALHAPPAARDITTLAVVAPAQGHACAQAVPTTTGPPASRAHSASMASTFKAVGGRARARARGAPIPEIVFLQQLINHYSSKKLRLHVPPDHPLHHGAILLVRNRRGVCIPDGRIVEALVARGQLHRGCTPIITVLFNASKPMDSNQCPKSDFYRALVLNARIDALDSMKKFPRIDSSTAFP